MAAVDCIVRLIIVAAFVFHVFMYTQKAPLLPHRCGSLCGVRLDVAPHRCCYRLVLVSCVAPLVCGRRASCGLARLITTMPLTPYVRTGCMTPLVVLAVVFRLHSVPSCYCHLCGLTRLITVAYGLWEPLRAIGSGRRRLMCDAAYGFDAVPCLHSVAHRCCRLCVQRLGAARRCRRLVVMYGPLLWCRASIALRRRRCRSRFVCAS